MRGSTSKSSTNTGAPAGDLVVGWVVGIFGVRGEVKVAAADGAAFRPGLKVRLSLPGGERRSTTIDAARPHKRMMIIRLRNVSEAHAARVLRGARIVAARRDLPKLPEHVYREADLVGMRVSDVTLGALGEVREVRHYPSCHMLVVGEKLVLVPMLHAYDFQIDLAARKICVKLPAGFADLIENDRE